MNDLWSGVSFAGKSEYDQRIAQRRSASPALQPIASECVGDELFAIDHVWRGWSSDTLADKPEKNQDKLAKSVNKMFDHFPPDEKG